MHPHMHFPGPGILSAFGFFSSTFRNKLNDSKKRHLHPTPTMLITCEFYPNISNPRVPWWLLLRCEQPTNFHNFSPKNPGDQSGIAVSYIVVCCSPDMFNKKHDRNHPRFLFDKFVGFDSMSSPILEFLGLVCFSKIYLNIYIYIIFGSTPSTFGYIFTFFLYIKIY